MGAMQVPFARRLLLIYENTCYMVYGFRREILIRFKPNEFPNTANSFMYNVYNSVRLSASLHCLLIHIAAKHALLAKSLRHSLPTWFIASS